MRIIDRFRGSLGCKLVQIIYTIKRIVDKGNKSNNFVDKIGGIGMKDKGEKLSLQEEGMKAFGATFEEQRRLAQSGYKSVSEILVELDKAHKKEDERWRETVNSLINEKNAFYEENEMHKQDVLTLEKENEDLKKTQVALKSAVAQVSIALAQQIIDLKKDCKEWENIANTGYYQEFRTEQEKVKALENDLAIYKGFHSCFKTYYGEDIKLVKTFAHNTELFDDIYDRAIRATEVAKHEPTIDIKA